MPTPRVQAAAEGLPEKIPLVIEHDLEDLIEKARMCLKLTRNLIENEVKPDPHREGYSYPLNGEQMRMLSFSVYQAEDSLHALTSKLEGAQ